MSPPKTTNKSEKPIFSLEEFPKWAQILFVCLQPIILFVNLYSIFLLFKSGNEAVGATAGFIALGVEVITLVFFYFGKIFDVSKLAVRQPSAALLITGPFLVLIISVFGYYAIFKVIAKQEFNRAIATRELKEANQALLAAKTLNFDVENNLFSEFGVSLDNLDRDNALWMAKLYRENGYDVDKASLIVTQSLEDAVNNKDELRAQKLAEVLILLDPSRAAVLAKEFNDAGVAAHSGNPPDKTLARIYLEVVVTIDESPSVEKIRNSLERSISLLNLAQILEIDDPQGAIQIYRKAIRTDDTNVDAYYQLSSFLLTSHQQDPQQFTEAVNIADTGLQHIDARFCRGRQNLLDDSTFHNSWSCFLLLTTEAGARFERNDGTQLIMPLLDRAILLAEQNNHFGPGHYTAEPYYYLARLSEPNSPKNVLCNIIMLRDRNLSRHQEWAIYAEEQLQGELCP